LNGFKRDKGYLIKMKSDNKKRTWIIIVSVLSVVCLVQSVIIFSPLFKKSPAGNILQDFDAYSSHLNQKYKDQAQDNFELFDRFFNDDFFSKNTDPFKEMERLSRELQHRMSGSNQNRFKNYWDEWIGKRFSKDKQNIFIKTKEKNDAYIVTIEVPNLEENSLDIDINEDVISVDGTFYKKIERKDDNGNIIGTHEIKQIFSKKIPVPGSINAADAKIQNKEERIIITLPKRQ